MSTLATRAELIKLARDFQEDVGQLEPLAALGVERLSRLRNLCADQLFCRYQPMYRRIAAASALVPARLAVTIGEKVFGPYLGGRIGSQLETERAIRFAKMASIPYLAEICETIDPRRVIGIIQAMPLDRVIAVGEILVNGQDHVTLGKFVDAVTDEQIDAMLGVIEDPETLLHTAFYTEAKERLDAIVGRVSDERLQAITMAGVRSGHFAEALALMAHVGEQAEVRLVNLSADLGEPVLNELVRLADEEGLWAEILPLVLKMNPDNQARVMQVRGLLDTGVLERQLRAIHALGLWRPFMPLLAHSSEALRATLIQVGFLYEPETMWSLFEAVRGSDDLPMLFSLLEQMSQAEKTAAIGAVFTAVNNAGTHAILFQMLEQTSHEEQLLLLDATEQVDDALIQQTLDHAAAVSGATDTWLYREMRQRIRQG